MVFTERPVRRIEAKQSKYFFILYNTPRLRPDTTKPIELSKPREVDLDLPNALRDNAKLALGNQLTVTFGKKTAYLKESSILRTDLCRRHEIRKDGPDYIADVELFGSLHHGYSMGLKPRGLPGARPTPQTTKPNIDESDLALLQLRMSYAQHKEKKQSNTTVFLDGALKLPTVRGGKQSTGKATSLGFLKNHRVGLFDQRHAKNTTTRSMPASPALGAMEPIKTAPDGNQFKADAFKTSLLHLLAVRPVSKKFIMKTLKCTEAALEPLLHKYGREYRLDRDKYDISDRGCKELDVWKFKYKDGADRRAAIERAVSAYDRLRLSREEKLWQMLLPREERGKGKILSKLTLHHGAESHKTPRINVENVEASKGSESPTGTDSDNRQGRLAPSDAESMLRSRSQDSIKKRRVSEKEAQSKRLLSKNPKKATQTAKVKKTNRPVRKDAKKAPAAEGSKVKSSEYVHESDEDVVVEDSITLQTPSTLPKVVPRDKKGPVAKPAPKPSVAPPYKIEKRKAVPPPSKKPSHVAVPKSKNAAPTSAPAPAPVLAPPSAPTSIPSTSVAGKKPVAAGSTATGPKLRASEASQGSSSMKRTISHQRTASSPIKPSPLGSSPPTNASDFDNDKGPKNGSSSPASPAVPLRKDGETAAAQANARPGTESLQLGSDRSLKRNANEIEGDADQQGDVPLANGHDRPAKRPSTSASSVSAMADDNNPPPGVPAAVWSEAQRFRKYHERYEQVFKDLATDENRTQNQIDKLVKMQRRLEEMKASIWNSQKV